MALAVQVPNASQDWHSSKLVVAIFSLFFFGENNETELISGYVWLFFCENKKTEPISGHKEALNNAKQR